MKRICVQEEKLYMLDFLHGFTEKSPHYKKSVEVSDDVFNRLTKTAEQFISDQEILKKLSHFNGALKEDEEPPIIRMTSEEYKAMRSAIIQLGYLVKDRLNKEFCTTEQIKRVNARYKEAIKVVRGFDNLRYF